MDRRTLLGSFALGLALLAGAGCHEAGPRPLVLVDGSGPAHAAEIEGRAARFEATQGRRVRVLRVQSGEDALLLATRGEAEVALVPEEVALGDFETANHGRAVATIALGASRLRVLEVNAKQHPTVDAGGAKALAAFLAAPPPP